MKEVCMKKKVFYQTSYILLFIISLFLVFLVADIYVIVALLLLNKHVFEYVILVACILVAPYLIYTIIRFARNRIIFQKEQIFVPESWGGKDIKMQYETKINYSEINNIYIISSTNNSLNKPLKFVTLPMPYIVFECNNSEQKAINVFYYSKKSIIKIIDEAIKRTAICKNLKEIESGDKVLENFLNGLRKK